MKLDGLPTPTDLMNHPQLAAIVALDTTLMMAMRAILAAHDELLNDDFPRHVKEADYWADRMVYVGYELVKVIEKYRRTVLQREFSEGPDF